MSTYEEFMVILTVAVLIVAILDYVNHKKYLPLKLLAEWGSYFCYKISPEQVAHTTCQLSC